jgi:hypothetical protein
MDQSKTDKNLVIAYLLLRKVIGVLGVSLPFILAIGAFIFFGSELQSSLSSYYHTGMRDVFVGILWAIGFFLFSYKGYERADNIAGNLACIFAIGVALFPTPPDTDPSGTISWIGVLHFAFAALFFSTLIYFSLFLFTKTDPLRRAVTLQKLQRNKVYKVCGYTMAACILLIGIYSLLPKDTKVSLEPYDLVFWLETIAIIAFGISWLIKGETFLKDKVAA